MYTPSFVSFVTWTYTSRVSDRGLFLSTGGSTITWFRKGHFSAYRLHQASALSWYGA